MHNSSGIQVELWLFHSIMGEDGLKVINAKAILSVVAMVPYPHTHLGPGIWYFLVEKMGLAIFGYQGDEDPDEVVPQEQFN